MLSWHRLEHRTMNDRVVIIEGVAELCEYGPSFAGERNRTNIIRILIESPSLVRGASNSDPMYRTHKALNETSSTMVTDRDVYCSRSCSSEDRHRHSFEE